MTDWFDAYQISNYKPPVTEQGWFKNLSIANPAPTNARLASGVLNPNWLNSLQISDPSQRGRLTAQQIAGLGDLSANVNGFNSSYGAQRQAQARAWFPQDGQVVNSPTPPTISGSGTLVQNATPPTGSFEVRSPVNPVAQAAPAPSPSWSTLPAKTSLMGDQQLQLQNPAAGIAGYGTNQPPAGNGLDVQTPDNTAGYANMAINGVLGAGQLGLSIASLIKGFETADFQRNMAERNYAAQIKAFNNAVEDRVSGRHASYGGDSSAQRNAEIRRKQV